MKLYKIDYEINGYPKFIKAYLKEEQQDHYVFITFFDGLERRINKQDIREMREVSEGDAP